MNNVYLIALSAFTVVMVVMFCLTAVVSLMARLARRTDQASTKHEPIGDEIPDEDLVIIAAAARAVLGAPVHLHKVHLHRERRTDHWGRSGRMDILASHQLARKR